MESLKLYAEHKKKIYNIAIVYIQFPGQRLGIFQRKNIIELIIIIIKKK